MGKCYFRSLKLKWCRLKLSLSTLGSKVIQSRFFFWTLEVIGGVSAVGFTTPIKGNQLVYMARIKQSISGLPINDWFLSTPDSNPIFTAICKILVIGNSYLLVNVFNALLIFISFHFLNESARVVLRIANRSRDHLFLICISILGLCVFSPDFHNGIAGMGIFSPQFQPSSFDGLLLISILSIVKSTSYPDYKLNIPQIILPIVIAVTIHPSIIVSACIVLMALLISTSRISTIVLQKPFSARYRSLVLTLIVLPYLVTSYSIEEFIYSQSELDAFRYLAYDRIPYHVVPSNFMNPFEIVRLLIVLMGTYFVSRSTMLETRLKNFLLFLTTLFMYLSISVSIIDRPVFLLTVPWRISGVLYPLFTLILLWKLLVKLSDAKSARSLKHWVFQLTGLSIFLIAQNMSKFLLVFLALLLLRTNYFEGREDRLSKIRNKRGIGLLCTLCISLGLGIMAQVSTSQAWRENPEGFPAASSLRKLELQGIGVVPPQFDNFRVDFGLSIFVDSKAPPFDGKSLVEWVKRLKIAERVQIQPEKLCSEISLSQVSWAIVPSEASSPSCFHKRTEISHSWSILER